MRSHVHRLLSAQRDRLTPQAVGKMTGALAAVQDALRSGAKDEVLKKEMERLEQAGQPMAQAVSHALWRENVEAILVVVTLVMAFRIFFFRAIIQIPTGSMQPTLFGVTSVPDFSRIAFHAEDKSKIQAQLNEQLRFAEWHDLSVRFGTG